MKDFASARRAVACCLRGDRHSNAAFAVALSLAFSGQAANAADNPPCQLHRVASLDMQLDSGGVPIVPVTVAGQTKHLIVDTGAIFSSLTEAKARAMNLNLQSAPPQMIRMFDGSPIRYQAFASGFMIGNIPLSNYTFMILPDNQVTSEDDGLLASDLLSHFDVELDFAKGKFNLFRPNTCGANPVYWGGNYARLPISFDDTAMYNGGQLDMQHIYVEGTLDGTPVKIGVDTGSTTSAMTLQQADVLFGWKGLPPDLKKEGQRNGDDIYTYTFKTLNIGGITVSNPTVRILSVKGPGVVNSQRDLLIGMDVLSQMHVYIAYPEKALYVTSAPPPAPSVGTYFSAGRSAMQRGDYDSAITAFTAALALNPAIVGAYLNRGEAHARKKEFELAVADDTQALTINPALFSALNDRCYHRALLRQDLDKALDDCNAAIKLMPKQAAALDSRGSVYFQMGKFDLAKVDFDSSIASRSTAATLYKRGVSKNRLGDAAGGKADIDAALKLDPHAGDELARMGVQP